MTWLSKRPTGLLMVVQGQGLVIIIHYTGSHSIRMQGNYPTSCQLQYKPMGKIAKFLEISNASENLKCGMVIIWTIRIIQKFCHHHSNLIENFAFD